MRYFTRFESAFGYLRAVVRSGGVRKYILTPIVVTKEQLTRFDRSGHIQIQTQEDAMLETRLRDFTQCVWEVVNPLIASGEFATMRAELLTTAILNHKREVDAQRQAKANAMAEATFQRKAEEAAKKGHTLHTHTPKEFEAIVAKLKKALTPEEWKALWEKGGNDGE